MDILKTAWGDLLNENEKLAALLDEKDARTKRLEAALNYVADMTYCGTDAEWHFKPGYDPQTVLDALAGKEG